MNRPNVNDNDISWEDIFNRRLQLVDNLSNFLEERIIVPLKLRRRMSITLIDTSLERIVSAIHLNECSQQK